jgi:hypothetical protein
MNGHQKTSGLSGKQAQKEIPSILDRYEAKYTIPESMIDEIADFISPYCSYDKYSEKSDDGFYKVNSLYFDSPEFLFLRQRILKAEKRFNMRIRSYGDNPQLPYFMEIKQKKGDVVRKFRAKVLNENIEALFYASPVAQHDPEDEQQDMNKNLFLTMAHIYNAQPQVIVQYDRKAFVSEYEEYARVTFDAGLRYMQENSYNTIPDLKKTFFCDLEPSFDEGCSVILELKFYTSFVPRWMMDLVRKFQLTKRGFSKYSTCIRPFINRYRYDRGVMKSAICNYI